jgi:ABC-type dipeptide/oligopeptide/nickel transport system permease subunit
MKQNRNRFIRTLAISFLVLVAAACLLLPHALGGSYAHQFREVPDAPPSHGHLLGTDDLGRDQFSRLLYGTRISLLLAPAAALLSSLLAAGVGCAGAFCGRWVEQCVMAATDLFLSLPWLFLLITVRALLPLNVSPIASVVITFALLGSLGWAAAARVVCADAHSLYSSDFILLARASGVSGLRLFWRHMIPNLKPVLLAQFWISIPVFILAEANLGVLGLGVAEPLPSWGSLLRELESFAVFSLHPWQFAPLVLLVLVVSCLRLSLQKQELPA